MKSKKGHGLALISVALMGIFYFFIFQAHQEAYEFTTYMGAEQNSLVGAFYYPEFALEYVKASAQQAAFETLFVQGITDCDANIDIILPSHKDDFEALFRQYIGVYTPEIKNIEVFIPDYYIDISTVGSDVVVEGFGYESFCDDITEFPEEACMDIVIEADCLNVRTCDNNLNCFNKPEPACEWIPIDDPEIVGFCSDITESPVADIEISDCYLLDSTECSGYTDESCSWDSSQLLCIPDYGPSVETVDVNCIGITKSECEYGVTRKGNRACEFSESKKELITAISPTLMEFQFSVYQDAHFKEVINCEGYNDYYTFRTSAGGTP